MLNKGQPFKGGVMNLICERKGLVLLVRIFGDINRFELTGLKQCLMDLKNLREAIVDLAEVDFAGTDFVNLLVEMKNSFPLDYHKIIIQNPNELVTELLALTQLDRLFKIHRTEAIPMVERRPALST